MSKFYPQCLLPQYQDRPGHPWAPVGDWCYPCEDMAWMAIERFCATWRKQMPSFKTRTLFRVMEAA